MSNITVSMKMSPKQSGDLYMKSIKQEKRIAELDSVLNLICNSNNLSELELAIEKAGKLRGNTK
mgnify:CR=1 FL=1